MWSSLLLCSLTLNLIPTTLGIPILNADRDRDIQDRSNHRHHRHHRHQHHRHRQQSLAVVSSVSHAAIVAAAAVTPIASVPSFTAGVGLAMADPDIEEDEEEDCDGLSDEPGTDLTSNAASTLTSTALSSPTASPIAISTSDLDEDDEEEDCDALDDEPVVSSDVPGTHASSTRSSTAIVPSLTSSVSASAVVTSVTSSASASASTLASSTVISANEAAGKRGLGWPWDAKQADFDLFKSTNQITWLYNWETWSPNPPSGITYIPTQRTTKGDENLIKSVQNVASKTILGWNEPDNAGQANLSPSAAAPLWKQYFNPLKSAGFKVVSPAITNSGAPNQGLSWLEQFNQACDNTCAYDVVATHWYGGGIDDFKSHVQSVHNTFAKPVWVTEFALTDSTNQARNLEFLKQAMAFLDGAAYVEKYAYFGAFRGDKSAMITQNGQLNDLGKLYLL